MKMHENIEDTIKSSDTVWWFDEEHKLQNGIVETVDTDIHLLSVAYYDPDYVQECERYNLVPAKHYASVHFLNCWLSEKECRDAEDYRINISNELSMTLIDALQLHTHAYNTLCHNNVTNLLDLLNNKYELKKLQGIGPRTVEEITDKFNNYVQNHYAMPSDELMEICFPHSFYYVARQRKKPKLYDGYEKFYYRVFSDENLGAFNRDTLPSDYKESVLHVIKETGFNDQYIHVAMRHFGIGDYTEPETLKTIGMSLNMTSENVRRKISKIIIRCRNGFRREILVKGITAIRSEEGKDDE